MKKRIISAVVALLIVIPLVIFGGIYFKIGIGIVGVIGFYEIMNCREKKKKFPLVVKIVSMLSFVFVMFLASNTKTEIIIDYKYLVVPFLLCMTLLIPYLKTDKYNIEDALYLIGAIILLGLAFNILMVIRTLDIHYFIYLILITIMSDTFAHFFGMNIGKYKLCPSVSPNKTIEGFIGGLIFGTFIPVMYYLTMFDTTSNVKIIIITIFISIMSTLGDLIFSSIKRHFDIKDFGNIMPGHGGILDRLDSLLISGLALSLVINII